MTDDARLCIPPQPSWEAQQLEIAKGIIKAICIGWDAEEADGGESFVRALKRARRFVGFKLAATCETHGRPEPCQECKAALDMARLKGDRGD